MVEYALALGKYDHEVRRDATMDDIARYIALRNIQYDEDRRARNQAQLRAKLQSRKK